MSKYFVSENVGAGLKGFELYCFCHQPEDEQLNWNRTDTKVFICRFSMLARCAVVDDIVLVFYSFWFVGLGVGWPHSCFALPALPTTSCDVAHYEYFEYMYLYHV